MKSSEFGTLKGKILTRITGAVGDDVMQFTTTEGKVFELYHGQDCCESVSIEDISGNLEDIIGHPLLQAEETSSEENPPGVSPEFQESFTWTFYKLSTIKGSVTIRWYGESNGYYSERVDFRRLA